MKPNVSRREVIATAGAGAMVLAASRLSMAQGEATRGAGALKPDKAPPAPADDSRAFVSQTAASSKEPGPRVPPAPKPRVRFALVGLGKLMVEEIVPALRQCQECEATTLVTGDPEKGRALARAMGLGEDRVIGYDQIAKLAADDRVDAVYIATPNSVHVRDAVAALRAGKHVLCEKPLTTTVEDGETMVRAAADAGRKLMCAYRVHHEPINNQMRRWVAEQKYGAPKFVVFDTVLDVGQKPQYRLSKELAGGGSLFDIGIYALNTTCWLLGEEPVEISAMMPRTSDARFDEVEGYIAFQLRFPSGCVANCTSSFGTARVNRYKIICERGWLEMEPATEYRGLRGAHGDDQGRTEIKQPQSVNQFAAEFDHFARAVRDGGEVASPGEEGVRDVRLMLKIYEAARSGRTVEV